MDNEVEIIHEDPFRFPVTFNVAGWKLFFFFQLFLDAAANGLILLSIVTVADHKIVGEGGDSGDVQDEDLFPLLIVNFRIDFLKDLFHFLHTSDIPGCIGEPLETRPEVRGVFRRQSFVELK